MLLNRFLPVVRVAMALAFSAAVASAQALPPGAAPLAPQVTAHGRGEVDVVPDRGELTLQVETRALDGARAGSSNAALARAVLDTLRAGFGLSDRDLATVGYNLTPQVVYSNDGRAPKVTGYTATSTVRVRTSELNRIGAMIDAGLAKGATGIGGLTFYLANSDDARRHALMLAVESARHDAEAMASASGGRLGGLIDVVADPEEYYRPMPQMLMREAAASVSTPIQVGEQKISASVTIRWRIMAQ